MPSLLFPSLPFPSPLSGRRFPFVLNVRSAACRLKRESGGNRDSLQHGTDGGAASMEAISLEPSCPGRRRCRSQNFTIVNHGAAMAEREGGSTGDWAASRVSEPPLTADIKSPASRVICLISITHSGLAGPGGRPLHCQRTRVPFLLERPPGCPRPGSVTGWRGWDAVS